MEKTISSQALTSTIKIALCDDHYLFMSALARVLECFDDYSVILKASGGKDLFEYLKANELPDILLLDIRMPREMNGYEVIMRLNIEYPEIKVIICSGLEKSAAIIEMFTKGAQGYVSKNAAVETLREAINNVFNGGVYFERSFLVTVKRIDLTKHKRSKIANNLTAHELEVAKLMASNLAYKQIADKLHITPNSLENLRVKIFEKTGVTTRVELAVFVFAMGLL